MTSGLLFQKASPVGLPLCVRFTPSIIPSRGSGTRDISSDCCTDCYIGVLPTIKPPGGNQP